MAEAECKYCHLKTGDMISCASCKQYSHPKCLELPLEIVPRVKTYDWQCNDCKYCYACHTIANEQKILFCDKCDRGYHTYCAIPPILRKPRGPWYCNICNELEDAKKTGDENTDEKVDEEADEEDDDGEVTVLSDSTSPGAKVGKPAKKKKKDIPMVVDTEVVDLTESRRDKRAHERKDVLSPTTSCNEDDEEQTNEILSPLTPAKPAKRKYTKKTSSEKEKEKEKDKPPSTKKVKKDENDNFPEKVPKTPKEKPSAKKTAVSVTVETQTDSKTVDEKENEKQHPQKESSDEDDIALAKIINQGKCMYANTFSSSNQCPFFGCDGSGNTRTNHTTHVSLSNCPLSKEAKRREKELLGVYASGDEVPLSQLKMQKEEEENTETVAQTPIENVVSESDIALFEAAKAKALKEMRKEMAPHPNGLKSIVLGNVEIDAWYKSQYPHDCSTLPKLYICEFCLDYMKTETLYQRHVAKCTVQHPPGDEIYRKDKLSVFEIDGAKATTYCQNLCLLAKLFLDHKTLWHDVAPFLFYIMTEADERGCHIIGYFSKEKVSFLNYNVSCILVLPHHMRKGYGRLLIDFSYLLTAAEGKTGSPERPFSDMGLMSYRKVWAEKLLDYISTYPEKETISIKGISEKMAMQATDVISTLQYLGMLKYWRGKHVIALRTEVMTEYSSKVKQRPKDYKELDLSCLKWKPHNARETAAK